MAKKKVEAAPLEEVSVPGEAVETAEKPVKASKNSVTVKYRDHQGNPTERTFSKDVHGENFAELADEFKKTNASRIIE